MSATSIKPTKTVDVDEGSGRTDSRCVPRIVAWMSCQRFAGYMADLLPVLERYIVARKDLATSAIITAQSSALTSEPVPHNLPPEHSTQSGVSSPSTGEPAALNKPAISFSQPREALVRIAWLSEEASKGANEKLHISKAILNSVRQDSPLKVFCH